MSRGSVPIGPTIRIDPSSLTTQERDHLHAMERLLAQRLAHHGPMPFDRYMATVLYDPELGYYQARPGVNRSDFMTAPGLGPWFGRLLAMQLSQCLQALGQGSIVELGGADAAMACALLTALHELGLLPERYHIVEPSPILRALGQQRLEHEPAWLQERVMWHEQPPTEPWQGILLGNEVLDALPAKRVAKLHDGFHEAMVTGMPLGWDSGTPDATLLAHLENLEGDCPQPWPTPYLTECRPALPSILASWLTGLQRGFVLFVDYGHNRSVYYHPQRRQGTLMCHRHHQTCDDPLLLPGLQDITVWVDWTAVHRALAALGWMLQGAATQAQFLVACLQHLQQGNPQQLQFWLQEAGSSAVLQTLLRPEAMGEGFKVALWSKAVELAAPLLPNRVDLR